MKGFHAVRGRAGGAVAGRRVACVFMVLAAAGLLVAVAFGATLVSILLVGLLLLCPLLMWVPFRLSDKDRERTVSEWRARRG